MEGMMAMLEVLTVVGMVVSVFYLVVSYERFVKGEFTEIVKWFVYGMIYVALYVSVREAVEYLPEEEGVLHYAAHFASLTASLCILKAAVLLDRFSRVFGFAEAEEEFAKVFVSESEER
jgi:NADPH-dependent 2,4-dienoyl-CoA reductase/sulfur reductase-like enzyme